MPPKLQELNVLRPRSGSWHPHTVKPEALDTFLGWTLGQFTRDDAIIAEFKKLQPENEKLPTKEAFERMSHRVESHALRMGYMMGATLLESRQLGWCLTQIFIDVRGVPNTQVHMLPELAKELWSRLHGVPTV